MNPDALRDSLRALLTTMSPEYAQRDTLAAQLRAGAAALTPPAMPLEEAAALATRGWSFLIPVDHYTEQHHWIAWFRALGYLAGGHPAPQPTEPRRVYRAAPASRRRGMSWTTSLDAAHEFRATGTNRAAGDRSPDLIWTATVAPDDQLAQVTVTVPTCTGIGHMHELIVDPARTPIHLHTATPTKAGKSR